MALSRTASSAQSGERGVVVQRLIANAKRFGLDKPRLTAFVAGAVAACGFEPLHWWPLTLLAAALLLRLVADAGSARGALGLGWLFGLGHFTLGNNWIATAFTYQADMPAWLGWIAVVLIALYLAIYPALVALGAWLASRRWNTAFLPAFAGLWIIAEWVRAWLFTGFAWNPLGIVLLGGFDGQGLAFLAQWIGTYGLSGIAVLLAGGLGLLVRPGNSRWRIAGAVAAALMLLPARGMAPPRQDALAYTLVQPDISQDRLNDPAYYEAHFRKTANLSTPLRPGQTRVVFWPESGVPDYLRSGYPEWLYVDGTYASDPALARMRLGQAIGPGSLLLTGAVDLKIHDGQAVAAYNVVTAVDERGFLRGGYAKAHLVPYGEYLALRWLLEPLGATRLVAGMLDFHPGPGPRTLDFGAWGQAGMQICYEIIFSGQVVDPARRPDYIFNPSNDAWFGAWGPPQHLAQARLRAIEEGLPVMRSTTNGISAVIDANGIVRQHVARHVPGRLDGFIPPAKAPTLFARFGNSLPLAFAMVLLMLSLVASRRQQR